MCYHDGHLPIITDFASRSVIRRPGCISKVKNVWPPPLPVTSATQFFFLYENMFYDPCISIVYMSLKDSLVEIYFTKFQKKIFSQFFTAAYWIVCNLRDVFVTSTTHTDLRGFRFNSLYQQLWCYLYSISSLHYVIHTYVFNKNLLLWQFLSSKIPPKCM